MTKKICIIILTTIFFGVLSAPCYNNIFVTNGFTITSNNETIICDKLTCPEATERCVIIQKTDDTNENITTTWQCIGENDKVLSEEELSFKNPDNNTSVNVHIEGGTSINPDTEKIFNETSKQVEKQLEQIQTHLNEFWKNFNPFGNLE